MCFVAGTPVHTASGLVNIENIQTGDMVLSRDPVTGKQGFKPVVGTIVTNPDKLYHLRYRVRHSKAGSAGGAGGDSDESEPEPESLSCTAEHPFYVVERSGFVTADELTVGMGLSLADGAEAVVEAIDVESAPVGQRFTTYNFQVADYNTYFVDSAGVWVHNSSRPCERIFSFYRKWRRNNKVTRELTETAEEGIARILVSRNGMPDKKEALKLLKELLDDDGITDDALEAILKNAKDRKNPLIKHPKLVNKDFEKLAYDLKTPVMEYTTKSKEQYLHFFKDAGDESKDKLGAWIVRRKEVEDILDSNLTSTEKIAAIKDRLALPDFYNKCCEVIVPEGTYLRTGVAGANEWGDGGAVQHQILSIFDEDWFGIPEEL